MQLNTLNDIISSLDISTISEERKQILDILKTYYIIQSVKLHYYLGFRLTASRF